MDAQALFTALKTKYPQSGLSDKELLGVASSLFATGLVTDDNVDEIVDKHGDSVKGLQSLFDSRFSSQKDALTKTLTGDLEKTFKEKYRIGEDGRQKEDGPKQQDGLLAQVAKMVDEKLKPFSDRVAQEEAKRKAEEWTAQVVAAAKAHGIDEGLARMLNMPGDVADLDSYMKDMSQNLTNLGFQPSVAPTGGNAPDSDGKSLAAIIKTGAPKKEPGK